MADATITFRDTGDGSFESRITFDPPLEPDSDGNAMATPAQHAAHTLYEQYINQAETATPIPAEDPSGE